MVGGQRLYSASERSFDQAEKKIFWRRIWLSLPTIKIREAVRDSNANSTAVESFHMILASCCVVEIARNHAMHTYRVYIFHLDAN